MTKTLMKKQLMELFSFFWQDKKKNQNRTGIRFVLFLLLYIVVLCGTISTISYIVADMLCEPLVMAKMDWLYFAIMGLIGIALGAFGSIFNTYASLYQAKDNELLLAMPVTPSKILAIRLVGVYAMGFMYEILVMIPVLVKYYMVASPGGVTIICSILVTLLLSIFILVLSAVLGFVVALISSSAKHKSLLTVVLSLCFLGAYYYIYGKAAQLLQEIAANPQMAGGFLKGKFSPPYHMGLAAAWDLWALLIFAAMVLVLFAVVCLVLAKSYLKIVTKSKGVTKKEYKEQRTTMNSVEKALLHKEFRRFLGSPNYMLNCGLGIVFMIIAAIFLLWKEDVVLVVMTSIFQRQEGVIALIALAAIAMLTSMNDITAPSVSLEGKTIWLVHVLPISGKQVLMAKLRLHLKLTIIPAAVLVASVLYVLKLSTAYSIAILIITVLFILFMALFGLFVNLHMPNLTWTNEIVPIKQSMGVMIVLFGGWAVVVALAAVYYLIMDFVSSSVFLIGVGVLLLACSILLFQWVRTRGAKVFELL